MTRPSLASRHAPLRGHRVDSGTRWQQIGVGGLTATLDQNAPCGSGSDGIDGKAYQSDKPTYDMAVIITELVDCARDQLPIVGCKRMVVLPIPDRLDLIAFSCRNYLLHCS